MFRTSFVLPIFFILTILLFMPSQGITKTFIHGQVIRVDTESNILILKISSKPINLDVSSPSFTGYKSIYDIKAGDWVRIMYSPSGVRIIRSSGTSITEKQKEPHAAEEKYIKKKNRFAKIQRVRTPGNSFRDIDNDHDGRITPVELSVVMPGLTMQKFREFDKNNDGYLDASEYHAAIKNR